MSVCIFELRRRLRFDFWSDSVFVPRQTRDFDFDFLFFFKVIQCLFPTAGGRGSLFFGGEVGKSRLFSHKGPHQDVLVNL